MLKLLVASLATASALKVKSQPAVKPLSNALKLRGGVSAADVAHYGQLFLCASVGVPALVGGSDLLFKINCKPRHSPATSQRPARPRLNAC